MSSPPKSPIRPQYRSASSVRAPSPFFTSRAAAILAGLVIFFAIVCAFAGEWWPVVLSGFLTDGAIAIAWVGAATMAGDVLLRRFIAGEDTIERPLRLVTAAGLGLGLFSLLLLGLGLAGWLGFIPVALLPILSAAVWFLNRRFLQQAARGGKGDSADSAARTKLRTWLLTPAGPGAIWLAAVPFLAIAATAASIMPGWLWKPHDPHPYDVMSYHLEIQREWYEAGRIFPLHHNAFSYFPTNQEMHYLAAMELRGGPWAGMYVIQFFSLIVMALAVFAVRGMVVANFGATTPREQRRAEIAGAIAGVMTATAPWVVMLASVPYVESGFLFYGILCGAWALRALLHPEGRTRRLALAGVMAGLAGGVKYTAAPMIGLAVLVAFLAASQLLPRAERRAGPLLRGGLIFVASAALVLSPWLVRNLIWTGNPFFPVAMRLLGHAHFSAVQVQRFVLAHSPRAGEAGLIARLHAIWREIIADWQFAYLLIPLGFIAAAARWRSIAGRFLFVMLSMQLIVWAGFTHLLPRFFTPAIPFAAAAVGFALRGRRTWLGIGAATVAVLLGLIAIVPLFSWELQHDGLDLRVLIGVKNPGLIQPESLAKLEVGNYKLALIGDGQAYFQQAPTSRMLYRSVFDVDIPPGQNVVDGWLGHSVEDLRRDGYIVLINVSELNRLSKTYHGIPPLPAQWQTPDDAPIILAPKK